MDLGLLAILMPFILTVGALSLVRSGYTIKPTRWNVRARVKASWRDWWRYAFPGYRRNRATARRYRRLTRAFADSYGTFAGTPKYGRRNPELEEMAYLNAMDVCIEYGIDWTDDYPSLYLEAARREYSRKPHSSKIKDLLTPYNLGEH